ncbi:hypothetical protein C8F01DRAFT_1221433 [Mycena amicta]|nr:hypothetical protein C8F01DRAFT_1221433 [Mycena amicta]
MEYPTDEALDACQGILITGSTWKEASAYEDIEWINKLVDFVARVAADRPTDKDYWNMLWPPDRRTLHWADAASRTMASGRSGRLPFSSQVSAKDVFGTESLEMHQDHVPEVPPDFHLLGSTSIAMNQGMVRFLGAATPASPISLDDIHIFTVQGHPEFTQGIVSKLTDARGKAGILTPEVVADATRRASWRNDGVTVIGKTILKIFGVI